MDPKVGGVEVRGPETLGGTRDKGETKGVDGSGGSTVIGGGRPD